MNTNTTTEQPVSKSETTVPQVVELTKAELLKDKENGLSVPEQALKYKLPVSQMRKALKMAGISIKAKAKAKFVIVE